MSLSAEIRDGDGDDDEGSWSPCEQRAAGSYGRAVVKHDGKTVSSRAVPLIMTNLCTTVVSRFGLDNHGDFLSPPPRGLGQAVATARCGCARRVPRLRVDFLILTNYILTNYRSLSTNK